MGHHVDVQRLGSLVGAGFGLIYVVVNTSALPTAARDVLRLVAVVAFVAVVVQCIRAKGHPLVPPGRGSGRPFGWIVAGEAIALFGGLAVLNGPLHAPRGGVAWVSFVVGVHFLALGRVFSEKLYWRLGGVITACGTVGLALTAAQAGTAPIDVTGGVVPGLVLLAAAAWGASQAGGRVAAPRTSADQ